MITKKDWILDEDDYMFQWVGFILPQRQFRRETLTTCLNDSRVKTMAAVRHILVVDDSLLARMMLKKFISKLRPDWILCEAKDGNDALEKIGGKIVDIALIDYNMPGISGIELAKKVKEQFPKAGMALITANIQDYIINEAKAMGISFISKPIEEEKIAAFFNSMEK